MFIDILCNFQYISPCMNSILSNIWRNRLHIFDLIIDLVYHIVITLYQRFSEGKIYHPNEFVKLMKNCATCTDNFILILFLVYYTLILFLVFIHVNLKIYYYYK